MTVPGSTGGDGLPGEGLPGDGVPGDGAVAEAGMAEAGMAEAGMVEAGVVEAGVVEAAGAVVWRRRRDTLEVLLVHRPRYDDWSWPKGKLDPGESAPAAAVREVAEETGLDVALGIPLPSRRYRLADGRTKTVHYWAATIVREPRTVVLGARPPVTRASPDEVDATEWLEVSAARRRLTRESDRAPLDALVKAARRGRLDTEVLAVVRHGRAKKRSAWRGEEADRPLTPEGVAQANALVPLLAAFGVRHVISSPWRRCLTTVLPYAEALGREPETWAWFSEAGHVKAPRKVARSLADLMDAPGDKLVCTHRPVLPTLMATLERHSRSWTKGKIPDADPYLKVGSVLVVHVAMTLKGPRVVAVETHRPHTRLLPARARGDESRAARSPADDARTGGRPAAARS